MTSTESSDPRLPAVPQVDDAGEAPRRRQYGNKVEVFLDNGTEDPEVFEVHVINPDRIRYEVTAARHPEWPKDHNASHVMTFVTWAAAKRQGLTTTSFEEWSAKLLDWFEVAATTVDPTRPTASPADTSS